MKGIKRMKKYIYLVLTLCLLASCDEWSMQQIEKELKTTDLSITDARQFAYTMESSDYLKVSSNTTNIALALSLDEDSTAYKALQAIGKNKYFTEDASADMYVPAFMANKFPQLSTGAQCQVTYLLWEGKSVASDLFYSGTAYSLVKEDYKAIWGGRGAQYLTAGSEPRVPAFLASKFPTATENKIILLTYEYVNAEPDTIYPDLPYECTIAQLLEAEETVEHQLRGVVGTVKSAIYGRFYLMQGEDSLYIYGLTDEEGGKVWKDKGIQVGDSILIKGKLSLGSTEPMFNEAIYISHTSNAPSAAARKGMRRLVAEPDTITKSVPYIFKNGEWSVYTNDKYLAIEILPQEVYEGLRSTSVADPAKTINTYLKRKYPYALEKDEYLVVYMGSSLAGDVFTYDGTDFIMDDGFTDETMTFVMKKAWEADISTYLNEPFVGHGQGDFEIQNVLLTGSLSYVWAYSAQYGMKASAYYSTYNPSEAWLISPAIRLKKSKHPVLIFDQASKYAASFVNECFVMVSNAFTGDVTTTEWKQLAWNVDSLGNAIVPDGSSWTFQSSGNMSLEEYNEQTIRIAFKYTSSATAAATWEIQNLLVHELEVDGEEE